MPHKHLRRVLLCAYFQPSHAFFRPKGKHASRPTTRPSYSLAGSLRPLSAAPEGPAGTRTAGPRVDASLSPPLLPPSPPSQPPLPPRRPLLLVWRLLRSLLLLLLLLLLLPRRLRFCFLRSRRSGHPRPSALLDLLRPGVTHARGGGGGRVKKCRGWWELKPLVAECTNSSTMRFASILSGGRVSVGDTR